MDKAGRSALERLSRSMGKRIVSSAKGKEDDDEEELEEEFPEVSKLVGGKKAAKEAKDPKAGKKVKDADSRGRPEAPAPRK